MNNYDQYDQESQALLQGIKPLNIEEIIGNKKQNKFRTNDSVLSSDYLSVFAKQYAFKSLTSKEITENYFNGIRPISNNNTTIIQEPETKVEIIPVYRENNGIKGFQENADKLLYKILVYISTSKDKLEDLYLKSEGRVNDNEILLFLEDNTNDFSEQYLFARFGKSIKKDDLLTAEGLAGLTSLVPDFSLDMLKELIRTGQVKSKNTITVSVAKGLLYLISLIGLPAKAIGWLCNEVGEAISKYLSVPETIWDSKGEDFFLNKDNVLKELQINTSFINTLSNSLKSQDQLSWFNSFQSQEKTAQLIARPINVLQEFTIAYNNEIQTIINSFYDKNSKDTQIDTLALSEQIAFLCGIWNGLVDFIAGIFKFLGMLLSAQYDITTNINDILETIDDMWDNIKKIKFTDVLIAAVTTYFQILAEINKFFTSKNPSEEYNFDRIAYFTGFGLAFIATLFIPIADITKVSSITNVSKLIPEEFLTSLSQIKGKAINGIKPLLALAREMSEVFSKGTDEIMAFFQRIKKAIVEWFLRNKEKIKLNPHLLMDVKEFVKTYTLTTAQHINYGHVRVKKINPKLPKNDPKRIIEEYKYTPKRGKKGGGKFNYQIFVGGMHNLNNLNRYVRLQGELKLLGKLPTGEKVYEGMVGFYISELKQWSTIKKSTFFPKKWSENKIKAVIEEASMNIILKKWNKYVRITKNGIQIEFRLNLDTREIETAFITLEKIN